MDTNFENINKQIENMVVLYTVNSNNVNIEELTGINTNVLLFVYDENNKIYKLYRGGGEEEIKLVGTETAKRLLTPKSIYGNEFDGTQDVSNNLTMSGTLDNSTGVGIFNKINTNEIVSNNIFLNDGEIKFNDGEKEITLKLKEEFKAELNIETIVQTKVFNTIEDVFNNEINDTSYDAIGTTYFVKRGSNDNGVPETFILVENDNGREIIPTSSYIISSEEPNRNYNYHKGNVIWIDKLYTTNNKEDMDEESGVIVDETIITPQDYTNLYNAVRKLYYIIGVDMDAGNVEDSSDGEGEGIDGGEFDSTTTTTRSNYGLILTDLDYNQKTAFNDFVTEEKPEWLAELDEPNEEDNEEFVDTDYDVILPDELSGEITSLGEHFVKAIRIKRGKYSDMMAKFDYLLEGELVWCVPERGNNIQSGKLYIKTKDTLGNLVMMPISSGNSTNEEGENYLTDLIDIEKIDWENDYRMKVDNDGRVIITKISDNPNLENDATRKAPKFYINSLYIGGENSQTNMYRYCSHNFIEICNLTNNDINLEKAGISLQYIDNRYKNGNELHWKILPLTGTIKAGGTYLVRGEECAPIMSNTTRLKIETYDQIWYDDEKPISFSDINNPVFVLCSSGKDYNNNILPIVSTFNNNIGSQQLYNNKNVYDLIGFDAKSIFNEKNPFTITSLYRSTNNKEEYNITDFLYIKYFSMDGVKQATKAFDAKDNSKDIYAINLREDYQKNISEYYTGKASYENKDFFYNKSKFNDKPNMIACSFGKRGTDDGINGATRCFNWISKGYYNEYVKITFPNGDVKYFESFKNKNQEFIYTGQKKNTFVVEDNKYYNYTANGDIEYDENGKSTSRFSYTGIYDRYRDFTTSNVPFTVHKFIIDGLSEGVYKYQIGKEECWSEEYTFTIKSDNDVNINGFNFIHHSDQQGFNSDEYVVWEIVANYIDEVYKENGKYLFDFTINTGDMTQNGNRVNEWLDYYQGGKKIFLHSEQMNTIGNNDLSPLDNTKLGDGNDDSKINPKNFDLYYCYDLTKEEQDNLVIEVEENNKKVNKLIPSNYSYNIGNCHFICVNSEITINTCKKVYNANNIKIISNAIAKWLENDLKKEQDKRWRIAYCHEMPFTILTNDNTLAAFDENKNEFILPNKFSDRHNVYKTPTGCHLNCLPIDAIGNIVNENGEIINNNQSYERYYWLSRLFEKYNVSLVLGGHKHTYSSSLPIKENIKDNILNRDNREDYTKTFKPIIQLKRSDLKSVYGDKTDEEYKTMWYNDGINMCTNDPFAYTDLLKQQFSMLFQNNICDLSDIEIVNDYEITYPIYVMCQASGYKLISNKELPGRYIPWLTYPTVVNKEDENNKTYYPTKVVGDNDDKELKCNSFQLYPIFIKWSIKNDSIVGEPFRFSINGNSMFYKGNTSSNGTYQLINEIGYNLYNGDKLRELENVDGVSNRKQIVINKK